MFQSPGRWRLSRLFIGLVTICITGSISSQTDADDANNRSNDEAKRAFLKYEWDGGIIVKTHEGQYMTPPSSMEGNLQYGGDRTIWRLSKSPRGGYFIFFPMARVKGNLSTHIAGYWQCNLDDSKRCK